MTLPNAGMPEAPRKKKLPLRDWIVLPLLGVFTILIMTASVELIARHSFYSSSTSVASCMIRDSSGALEGIPNSVCREKGAENRLVEYRFNSCGDRTSLDCGTKAPDTFRIVMAGSSTAMGAHVELDETFAALLPAELSIQTRHRIELYNEGLSWKTPREVSKNFGKVLKAQPGVILWILTPWDMDGVVGGPKWLAGPGAPDTVKDRVKQALTQRSLPDAIPEILAAFRERWNNTASGAMVQHYLYLSQSEYVKLYLAGGGGNRFMMVEPGSDWQAHMEQFNIDAANVLGQAKAAGVPVVTVLIPNRAQAAMISMGEWPAGFDPYKLGDELRTIITSDGGIYIDLLRDFRTLPNPERYYFPVDGHLNAQGDAIIAGLLAKELTSGSVPALSIAETPRAAQE